MPVPSLYGSSHCSQPWRSLLPSSSTTAAASRGPSGAGRSASLGVETTARGEPKLGGDQQNTPQLRCESSREVEVYTSSDLEGVDGCRGIQTLSSD